MVILRKVEKSSFWSEAFEFLRILDVKNENSPNVEAQLLIMVACVVHIFDMLTYSRKEEGSTSHPAR